MYCWHQNYPQEALRTTFRNLSDIGCLPYEVDAFDNTVFVDRPFGDITGASAVQQCHDAGGIAILNHPFGPTKRVSFDWTVDFRNRTL